MPTKKTAKPKSAKKPAKKVVAKKPAPKKAVKPKAIPVGKGPIGYTTSNVFKAPVAKVWAAAVEKKHLVKHFVDDMRGDFAKDKVVGWFWKEWGWWDVQVVKYVKNKELVMQMPEMSGKYSVTVRYEILKSDGKTIFRIHESGYPTKDLQSAFMMCEGWSEFHTGIKAHLMGVDLRKA